jgi:hypothetical protein
MTLPTKVIKAIADAGRTFDAVLAEFGRTDDPRLVGYTAEHRREAINDLLKLADGQDCCYDRPGIGAAYALWYQPRRVHDAARALAPMVAEAAEKDESIHLIDLGAGTGSTTCAIQLTIAALLKSDRPTPPRIVIDAFDSSTAMLRVGNHLVGRLGDALGVNEVVEHRGHLALWHAARELTQTPRTWIVAGHLFDASEVAFATLVARRLTDLARRLRPDRLVVIGPHSKANVQQAIHAELIEAGATAVPNTVLEPIWQGKLRMTGRARRALYESAGVKHRLLQCPSWSRDECAIKLYDSSNLQSERLFSVEPTGLALDEHQDEAAFPDERLTILVGSAGSGKSTVLIERLARTLEQARAPRRVLLTSFNVAMVDQLRRWLQDRLPSSTLRGRAGDWRLTVDKHRVDILNWDKIPTQLLRVDTAGGDDIGAIHAAMKRLGVTPTPDQWWLQNDFLIAELKRFIYGRGVLRKEEYLMIDREGRGTRLSKGEAGPRGLIWDVLMSPVVKRSGFTYRWIEIAHRLQALGGSDQARPGLGETEYTDVFVDECQDFTRTDYRIASALVTDTSRLVATGDEAQAMHLGPSYRRPGELGRHRWKRWELDESYRLPLRICEAVAPLARLLGEADQQTITEGDELDVGLPTGSRSGVLGCRPVVLAAGPDLREQLMQVFTEYSALWAREGSPTSLDAAVTVAEVLPDTPLISLVEAGLVNGVAQAERMRAIKGLERACVVWNTGHASATDEATHELVYTILTRAVHLLVIIVDAVATSPAVKAALAELRRDRLLFWDSAASLSWDTLCDGLP